jgi:hypothetical protein
MASAPDNPYTHSSQSPWYCQQFGIPCASWAQTLYGESQVLDFFGLVMDTVGEGMAAGGAILGAAGCSETGPGLGCAVGGYFAGDATALGTSNAAGNYASFLSTGATVAADLMTGQTYKQDGQLTIGQNTVNSVLTTAAGLTPDTTVDLVAAGIQYGVNDKGYISPSALPGPLRWFAWNSPAVVPWP